MRKKKAAKKPQTRPTQIPDANQIPDEVVFDVYCDATEHYEVGEVKSKNALNDKEDTLALLDSLIDSVREEAFCKGYRLGYSHGKDGLPLVEESNDDGAEQEGWV